MPTDLVPKPSEWQDLTPISVILGLFCIIITVGIPWAVWTHRKDIAAREAERANDRKDYLATIEKQSKFIDTASERMEKMSAQFQAALQAKEQECAAERRQIHEQFEARLREVVQSKFGTRR